jgi:Tn7-like transposition protein D/TniQ
MELQRAIATHGRSLLRWLPGETLFSLISRHHVFWGHATAASTTRLFFDHDRGGSQHDLPSRLSRFVDHTAGAYGTASELALRRTLLGFYQPFLDPLVAAHACEVMAGDDVSHLKLRVGVLTSRFRAHHPLKACDACLRSDLRRHGWRRWHLDHQYPGVWCCPRHPDHLLRVANVKVNGVERFQWHLPHERLVRPPSPRFSPRTHDKVASLAAFIVRVVEGDALPQGALRRASLAAFAERGWLTEEGHLRLRVAAREFLDYAVDLQQVDELRALPQDENQAARQLGQLLRRPRGGTHPLRYLMMAHWLYGDALQLNASKIGVADGAADARSTIDLPLQSIAGSSKSTDSKRESALRLLNDGQSCRQVARLVGVDTKTVLGWAELAGFDVKRRPKNLSPSRRQSLVVDLRHGSAKEDAARAAGVSVSTVNAVLFSVPHLHETWKAAVDERRRQTARDHWRLALASTHVSGVKAARNAAPAAYQWLYRHDRQWLDSHCPLRSKATTRPVVSHDLWAQRDRTLSRAVDAAAFAALNQPGQGVLHRWQLCQAVDDLAPRLRRLDVLPRTAAALRRALAHRSTSR